ncbi:MAG: DUF4159 domain-containing protein, partial [Pseudomonadales bacterium]
TSTDATNHRMRRTVRNRAILAIACIMCFSVALAIAQRRDGQPDEARPRVPSRSRGDVRWRGGRERRLPSRSEFPTWQIDRDFEHDVFTFVRIQYDSFGSFGWWDRWDNDYPDGDLNFSYRLQELTTLEVVPNSQVIRLSDPDLFDYPFVYMTGVGKISLRQQEQSALRRYLLNGGFVMLDDFWQPEGWAHVLSEMRGVFPDREPKELSLDHEIFHIVYDLKELPQVVDIRTWSDGYAFEHRHGGSSGDQAPHFWAYFDDHRRMVALLCHNNDLGDGWEREGENREYFRQFSVKRSYPMGINIVTYAMTH